MQLKYDHVKKVENRSDFYRKERGWVIFSFVLFFLLDQGQGLGLVRLMKSSTFGLSLVFDCYYQLNAFFVSYPPPRRISCKRQILL